MTSTRASINALEGDAIEFKRGVKAAVDSLDVFNGCFNVHPRGFNPLLFELDEVMEVAVRRGIFQRKSKTLVIIRNDFKLIEALNLPLLESKTYIYRGRELEFFRAGVNCLYVYLNDETEARSLRGLDEQLVKNVKLIAEFIRDEVGLNRDFKFLGIFTS